MASANTVERSECYYFAIGSMVNPKTAVGRGIEYYSAKPGKLPNHKIHWFGFSGAAEAVVEPGTEMHGVIYHLSKEAMEKLDKIEQGYIRKTAKAYYYDDSTELDVSVYCRPDSAHRGSDVDRPPTQRYIEVIVEGAKHYGIDESYIHMLQSVEYQPRPKPSEYLSFGQINEDLPIMSLEDVRNGNGQNDKPLYITCNGKVLQLLRENDDEEFEKACQWYQGDYRHIELLIGRLLYDPKYCIPNTLEDVTREHSAYTEHVMCDFLKNVPKSKNKWKIAGRFQQTYKE